MGKASLIFSIENNFSEDISRLREICFPNDYSSDECKDEFDDKSGHVTVRAENDLIAYVRLTPGPNAVFYHWSKGLAQIPYGSDSIDLTRCMVNPEYRRKGLMHLVCITGLYFSKRKRYKHANGAIVVGNEWIKMLESIGLKRSGPIVQSKNESVNPLSCDFDKCAIEFEYLFKSTCENLAMDLIIENHILNSILT